MKKIISILLAVIMVLSLTALVGCNSDSDTPLKMGMGVYSNFGNITSADGDTNGTGEAVTTVAIVLVDAEGKVVKCEIDTMSNKLAFTSEGKYVEAGEFKTKYELGNDYGMVAYAKAEKEWFEQVDAFEALVAGKTLEEVRKLIATEGKGSDEVVKAGCTIVISDFVKAVEKAVANATESDAKADNTLKLGFVSTQTSSKDASEENTVGMNEVDTTVVGVVMDKDNKVVAAATDAVQAKLGFDNKGAAQVASNTPIKTKKELGKDYGMVAYAKADKEWFEQAAAFDALLKGKTSEEIAKLAVEDGKPADSLQKAGCTINVGDMVKAAVKAAKAG